MPPGVPKSAKCSYPRIDEARHNAEPDLRRGDACVALLPVAQMWIEKGEACLAPTQASTKPASAHWIDGR